MSGDSGAAGGDGGGSGGGGGGGGDARRHSTGEESNTTWEVCNSRTSKGCVVHLSALLVAVIVLVICCIMIAKGATGSELTLWVSTLTGVSGAFIARLKLERIGARRRRID
jgi:hypothetical protein